MSTSAPLNHQKLYPRNADTPLRSGSTRSKGRYSSFPPPPPLNKNPASRRRSSVASQRSTTSTVKGGKKKSKDLIAAEAHTHVADVNPVFCVDGSVRCVEPISDRVAWTAEYDGTLRIRALPQGSELKEVEGRSDTFCACLLYLEQQQRVWAGFNDGFIRVYDSNTSKMLMEVVQHAGGINCMVAMEGSVYTGGVDWKIGLWNPENAAFERLLFGHAGAVRSLCPYSGPSGSILFSGSDDGSIRAWDPYAPVQVEEDRACLHIFKGHTQGVLALEGIPQLSQLWSAGEDQTVRVWDLQTLQQLKVLRGHTAPVASLLPVEARMWSGDKHGRIILWDINTFTPLQEITSRMHGAKLGMVLTMKKIQPSECWKVWTAGSAGFVQCWNAETVPILFDAHHQRKYGNRGVHELAQEMEAYIQSLEQELATVREDAEMNYERGRLEVQRELTAHQLLQGENERLKNRLRELEGLGEPQGDLSQREFESTEMSRTGISARGPTSFAIYPPGHLYKGSLSSSQHQRSLSGLCWESVLRKRPHQVQDVARSEVCMALAVPPAQISKLELEAVKPRGDGLSISCTVTRPGDVTSEDVQHRLDLFSFPRLVKLHDEEAKQQAGPKVQLDAAEDRIRQLERQLGSSNEERKSDRTESTEDSSNLQREVERLKDENDILRGLLDEASETPKRGSLEEREAYWKGVVATKEAEQLALVNEVEHLQKELEAAGAPAGVDEITEQEMEAVKQNVAYLKDVIEVKEREHAAMAEEVQHLQKENAALRDASPSIVEPSNELQDLAARQELENAHRNVAYLKDLVEVKEKERVSLLDEVNQLRRDNEELAASQGADTPPQVASPALPDAAAIQHMVELEKVLQRAKLSGQSMRQSMDVLQEMILSLYEKRRQREAGQVEEGTSHPERQGMLYSSHSYSSHQDVSSRPSAPHPLDTTARGELPDVSSSTEASSSQFSLQGRVQRDTLERPPYPRWAQSNHSKDEDELLKSPSPQARHSNDLLKAMVSKELERMRQRHPTPSSSRGQLGATSSLVDTPPPRRRPSSSCHSNSDLAATNAALLARVQDAEAVAERLRATQRQSRR